MNTQINSITITLNPQQLRPFYTQMQKRVMDQIDTITHSTYYINYRPSVKPVKYIALKGSNNDQGNGNIEENLIAYIMLRFVKIEQSESSDESNNVKNPKTDFKPFREL